MDVQSIYQDTIKFAAAKHAEKGQTITGTSLPYVVHLSNVAMEILMAYSNTPDFDLPFAIRLALLHDTLEDTATTFDELSAAFGIAVAEGVSALTKIKALPKPERMADSLRRIIASPKEVQAVKLADRITNLQEPPHHWDALKKADYLKEAQLILQRLSGANTYLEMRMINKITEYQRYVA